VKLPLDILVLLYLNKTDSYESMRELQRNLLEVNDKMKNWVMVPVTESILTYVW